MERNNPFRTAAIEYIFEHQNSFGSGRNSEIQVIIPDESVLLALYENFGVESFEEMFPNGKRDLNRVLSKMIFPWSNLRKIENNQIDGIRILDKEELISGYNNLITIYYIEGMLQDDESANYLEGIILSEVKGAKSNFTNLPSDVLQLMIETGEIVGKDLTSICATNQRMRDFCHKNNYEIFRIRLLKEYGVRYDESWYRNQYNPVELYKQYHSDFLRVEEYDTDQFGAQYFVDNNPESSFDSKVFSEVTHIPGLFDYFPETTIPESTVYGIEYYLIFDMKAPEKSASLYFNRRFLFMEGFRSYGTHNPILSYLETTQSEFKRTLDRNIANRLSGHFTFNGKELTFVRFDM